MSRARDERYATEVDRLLAGAAQSIATIRYCWLATAAETGGTNLRPMGWLLHDGENDWTVQFVTDGRSRKVADIRRASKVAIIFQHEADDAYITLIGTAALRERASEVRERWKGAYDAYFPTEPDRANAVFFEVEVEDNRRARSRNANRVEPGRDSAGFIEPGRHRFPTIGHGIHSVEDGSF